MTDQESTEDVVIVTLGWTMALDELVAHVASAQD